MEPLPALRRPFEMLDRIGHGRIGPAEPDLYQHFVQEWPCWPDEGETGQVFLVAWDFPHQHELCVGYARPKKAFELRADAVRIVSNGRRRTTL
jgi:hypothetical protein